MSLAKQEVPSRAYIKTGKEEISSPHAVDRKLYRAEVNRHSTMYTLFTLAGKHKTGLLITWGAVVTTMWLFPFVPALLLSMLQSV